MDVKYKAELRIPTEMYSFLNISVEETPEEIVRLYREFTELVKVQPKGISDKDFRELYDKVAKGEPVQGDPGIIEELNPQQRFALNQAKLFVKRNNNN